MTTYKAQPSEEKCPDCKESIVHFVIEYEWSDTWEQKEATCQYLECSVCQKTWNYEDLTVQLTEMQPC